MTWENPISYEIKLIMIVIQICNVIFSKPENLTLGWFGYVSRLSPSSYLTLQTSTPQNRQTHSKNLSAVADEFFECVWLFYGVDA